MARRMEHFIKAMHEFVSNPWFGPAFTLVLTLVGAVAAWKMTASLANGALVLAWGICVGIVFLFGPVPSQLLPRILWTGIVGSILGIIFYYSPLWTDEKKGVSSAEASTPEAITPDNVEEYVKKWLNSYTEGMSVKLVRHPEDETFFVYLLGWFNGPQAAVGRWKRRPQLLVFLGDLPTRLWEPCSKLSPSERHRIVLDTEFELQKAGMVVRMVDETKCALEVEKTIPITERDLTESSFVAAMEEMYRGSSIMTVVVGKGLNEAQTAKSRTPTPTPTATPKPPPTSPVRRARGKKTSSPSVATTPDNTTQPLPTPNTGASPH